MEQENKRDQHSKMFEETLWKLKKVSENKKGLRMKYKKLRFEENKIY